MNLFREMLKHIPKHKIELIADDPKDQEVANQLSRMINYHEEITKNGHIQDKSSASSP